MLEKRDIIKELIDDIKNSPYVFQQGPNIYIGPFVILSKSGKYSLNESNTERESFFTKKAAVSCAISLCGGRTTSYNIIKKYDNLVGKFREDIHYYNHYLRIAQKKNDDCKIDIMKSRIVDAKIKLNQVEDTLFNEIKKVKL